MADWELELEGLQNVLESLDDLEARLDSDTSWVVGTAVEYSIYLELGTSDMDPKPFFRPALAELRTSGVEQFIEDHTQTTVEALDTLDQVVGATALALERRIKDIITQKGLVDTGTLRASVLAVPNASPDDLPGDEEFSGFTADNPAPPSAGQALVSRDIDINV